ncbi:hypothetical protein NDA17_005636 [Ustilago hordei]|nr:hypothetical protein NDA17_005636 [Ustilago hordei]
MTDNTKIQAGASKAKGGRKGKVPQPRVPDNDATNKTEIEATDEETDSDSDQNSGSKRYNFRTLVKLLEPVPKLMSQSYYSWNVHIKSFLQSVPHAMKHLEGTYDKNHPKWNCVFDDALTNAVHGTINTTGEYNINYLILDIIREYHTFHQIWKKIENGLTNEAIITSHRITLIAQLVENYPTQKIDPHQVSARVAGSDNQEEPAARDEKDEDNANAKVSVQPRKLQCWVCK